MFKSKNNEAFMPSKRFKKSLLAVSIIAMSVPTFAQTADQDANLEEVVVTGMRSSLNTAQELKRNADTVKDVITASDIGALPDKSVTEALQRVPGVTIERFASSDDPKHYADEGTGVLVRGLDRVRSEVNDRAAFSANPWGGLNYEDFPAELLGAVEVVKNQTADKAAGGIAGTVNLITRKPLDSDERLISVNAKANYGDFRDELTPSFSALFSDSWETSSGTFGFLVAGSHSEFETRGDGVGLGNFHSRGTDLNPPAPASYDMWGTLTGPGKIAGLWEGPCVPRALAWTPSCNGIAAKQIAPEDAYVPPFDGPAIPGQGLGSTLYVPAQYHLSTAENDRERTGFTTSFQWENADETILATLEHINSKASLESRERTIGQAAQGFKNFMGRSHNWSGQPELNRPLTFNGGFLTSGIGLNVEAEVPLNWRSRWSYNENTVEDTSFNLVLKPMDRLTVELDYQHIDSEKLVENYSMSARTRGGDAQDASLFFLDLRGSRPTIEFLNPNLETPYLVKTDEPSVFLGTGMEQQEFNEAKADSFAIDVAYELDGLFTQVKAGVYYTDKDLTVRDTNYAGFSPIGTPWVPNQRMAASALTRPELFERVDLFDLYHGKVLQGDVDSFMFPKMDLVKNYADSLRRGCAEGWSAPGPSATEGNAADGSLGCAKPYADMAGRNGTPFAPQDISASNEKRTEFYVRGDFEFDELTVPIKGNVGLRYVGYQLESTGYLVFPSVSRRGTGSAATVLQRDWKPYYDLAIGGSTAPDGGVISGLQSTVEGTDYDTVLPSLNLSFGLHDDVVLRFGASQGLFFPSLLDSRNTNVLSLDYTSIRQDQSLGLNETTNPVVEIRDVALSAAANNPFLEPEESVNLDLSAEWYFASAGSLTLGVFYKELDNIIRNTAFDQPLTYEGFTYPASAYGPSNTGSGTIRGAELSYSQFYDMLPGAWSGLGLQFNFTYIDQNGLEDPNGSRAPNVRFNAGGNQVVDRVDQGGDRNNFRVFSGLPLQGYSDQNMNVVGMYEYNDISFRLAYTWRSEYLLTLRESEDYVPAYAKASGMVDASLYYTINDSWKVGIEGSNLLDTETKTQYQLNQEGDRTDALSFTTDRRYALSVRATF